MFIWLGGLLHALDTCQPKCHTGIGTKIVRCLEREEDPPDQISMPN